MTITVQIPPEAEARLRSAAAQLGVDAAEYAQRLIEQGLSQLCAASPAADRATAELLARWDAEDATSDPAEIARRQQEWEEFRNSMNTNSLSGRPIYP
jgi:uncharacterized protein YhaN